MRTVNEIGPETSLDTAKPVPMEFDILDLLLILALRKRVVLVATGVCLLIAMVVVLLMRPTFTAKAVIMPPQKEQSTSSALMGQLSALASLGGMGGSLGTKDPNDLYIGILQSETVADSLIKRFDLMHLYHAKRLSAARRTLAHRSKFLSGKDDLINISVVDHDPHRAAAMANAYVDQLYKLNNRLAFTQASQRRIFFQQQLAQEKDHLADAEVALEKTEEATGVIAPMGQMTTIIREVAQLQAEITSREVQLDALRTSSTEQNSEVVRLNTELEGLRAQLAALESKKRNPIPGNILIPSVSVPQTGLEYIRKERDVKYHEFLFDLLARQYEAARIDEAKAAPVIQVVDPALVPDKKSGPFRALWVLVGGALGFFFSVLWIIGSYFYRLVAADSEQGPRLAALREALRSH